ncbi:MULTISPECIES: glyoxalase superfamily protein [unclassified Rhizobium]|uniref:glyoxalase superfamily protein n=1 Tax=unclassified Rhizobium TaxID=2613769 RepID=UPI000EAA51BF|nr:MULTISPECIES: glyoxalase superfamily protein [unclassified Rhizobium]AYG66890.1 glyoxalase/bleomycin resistance/extradiol dioxygenase family protein [Rhizobium sp. CCGE531]AYG73270.1 glyoxalase/bleomycin resistance/extradiol dioxygenase family protein [Rhizobium sp. CCGE532]
MPTLDTYRKQAKLLMRWHRDRDYSIGGRVRTLDRFRALTDREILAMKFPLTLAQEIVAVEAGHGSWAELKAVAVDAPKMPAQSTKPPVFKSVVPILFVRDVTASAAFFREKLGFAEEFLHGAPPFYGAVSRDGICIHLRLVYEPYFAAAAAKEGSLILASIEVSNVQGLFEEFKKKGVEFAQPLTKQAWGGTDFHVRDPDGNVISFVAFRS